MDQKVVSKGHGFATYPAVKLKGYRKNSKGKVVFGFLKELLFGDYIRLLLDENGDPVIEKRGSTSYVKVRARRCNGYIKIDEIQANRTLEVNFVDVAQGDGCHIVTPEDKHFVIDAGQGDNMYRFLAWRFNLRRSKSSPPEFTAIISHSDKDHYGGFGKLFTKQRGNKNQFKFNAIYHNGLVEESGRNVDTLGLIKTHQGSDYITGLARTNADFKQRVTQVAKKGNYIRLLEKTESPKKSLQFGDEPIYDTDGLKISVLGPVVKTIDNKMSLPVLDNDKGKTKNGHSIILKLTIGKLRMLLGGDLNSAAEHYLFSCFTNKDMDKLKDIINSENSTKTEVRKARKEVEEAISGLRKHFQVDIAKSCHHGSADFTHEFFEALNPVATVISSGDQESHSHPRPDTLGAIGKTSRGNRPLIFSTELARSGKEFVRTVNARDKTRTVTVYGMINVRTDGEKVIIAQKLEKPGSSKNWDIYKLVWNDELSELEYVK